MPKVMTRIDWKVEMEKHDKLRGKGGGFLWDRMQMLNKIKDDEQFIADVEASGTSVEYFLNQAVNDSWGNFTLLSQVLLRYPDRDQWATILQEDLKANTLKALDVGAGRKKSKSRVTSEVPEDLKEGTVHESHPERSLSWKARCMELEQEIIELRAENATLRENYQTLLERVTQSQQ